LQLHTTFVCHPGAKPTNHNPSRSPLRTEQPTADFVCRSHSKVDVKSHLGRQKCCRRAITQFHPPYSGFWRPRATILRTHQCAVPLTVAGVEGGPCSFPSVGHRKQRSLAKPFRIAKVNFSWPRDLVEADHKACGSGVRFSWALERGRPGRACRMSEAMQKTSRPQSQKNRKRPP